MKIKFEFTCCCADRFAKIYGKIMKDLNKQHGGAKKARESRSIIMTETKLPYVAFSKLCSKCHRKYGTYAVTATKINLEITHGTD